MKPRRESPWYSWRAMAAVAPVSMTVCLAVARAEDPAASWGETVLLWVAGVALMVGLVWGGSRFEGESAAFRIAMVGWITAGFFLATPVL